jgi:formate hydrogenlyase transcriptional activator
MAMAKVLIQGETGTGKELIAGAIHRLSQRRQHAFVRTFRPDSWKAELFGHEKGAFTGAVTKRIGRFELADRGTIFLEEVGETRLAATSRTITGVDVFMKLRSQVPRSHTHGRAWRSLRW